MRSRFPCAVSGGTPLGPGAIQNLPAPVRLIDHCPLFLRLDAGGRIRRATLRIAAWRASCSAGQGRAGLDPLRLAGRSLRAGLATFAAAGGVSERAIMNQTGRRSLSMVRRCIRDGAAFRDDNAAPGAGLWA
jgi:hypothetical protein